MSDVNHDDPAEGDASGYVHAESSLGFTLTAEKQSERQRQQAEYQARQAAEHAETRRHSALIQAVQAYGSDSPYPEIVRAAEAFDAFLVGVQPTTQD